jgi:hypothetical protein
MLRGSLGDQRVSERPPRPIQPRTDGAERDIHGVDDRRVIHLLDHVPRIRGGRPRGPRAGASISGIGLAGARPTARRPDSAPASRSRDEPSASGSDFRRNRRVASPRGLLRPKRNSRDPVPCSRTRCPNDTERRAAPRPNGDTTAIRRSRQVGWERGRGARAGRKRVPQRRREGEHGDRQLVNRLDRRLTGERDRQLPLREELTDEATICRVAARRTWASGEMALRSRARRMGRTGELVETRAAQRHRRVARDQRGEQELSNEPRHGIPDLGAFHAVDQHTVSVPTGRRAPSRSHTRDAIIERAINGGHNPWDEYERSAHDHQDPTPLDEPSALH